MTVGFNSTPELDAQEPTKESLVDVVEGRPIVRLPNYTDSERCQRCERKNDLRYRYDLPEEEETFLDGHRVRLLCVYNPDPREGQGWVVTAAYHLDHPMKERERAASTGVAQAQVTVRLDQTGWTYEQQGFDDNDSYEHHVEDASVARDLEFDWFSPIDDGEEREPINEPDENGHIELKPTDPRPNWPAEENEWREKIMRENDDWDDEIPTTHI